jgi:tetratricopeptide (TPR) repeat protein
VVLWVIVGGGCAAPRSSPQAAAPVQLETSVPASRPSDADLKRRSTAHAHYTQGVIFELEHREARSLSEFRAAALVLPEDEDLVWEVSRKFLANQDPAGAAEVLERAAECPGASGLTLARLAAVELQRGNTEAAFKAAQDAIQRDPCVLQGYQTIFLVHLQRGQSEAARHVLETAEPYGHSDPEFLIQLSELYALLSAHSPAFRESVEPVQLRLLERAATLPIAEDTLRMRLADGFAGLHQDERAAVLYQELLETSPDAPGMRDIVRAKLTEAYLRGKDPSRAREHLEHLLKSDPTNVRLCYLLGTLAYQDRDLQAARDYFQRILVLRPEFQEAYYDLAEILLNLNLTDEAEEVVSKARQKFPQSFALELLSALVHVQRGEHAAALGYFMTAEITAQAVDPERLTHFFYFQYGAASERAGEVAAAERHLKKSLELDPGFAPAQNYLGYLWAERGEHLEEALELTRKAVRSEPTNAAYLDSLAWVLFKLNRPQEALAEIQKAIEHLEKPDATVYEHLGDIRARRGEWGLAVEAWKKAIGIERSDAVLRKLEQAGHPVPPPNPGESSHER